MAGMTTAADVRARYPLTLRHLGEAWFETYLAHPGGASFLDHVSATHADGSIAHRGVRDLARYEHETARLRALPPLAKNADPLPPDDAPLCLSPDASLIMYGADLPGMMESLARGQPATPRPRRNWFLLLPRGAGEVEVRHLEREEGWLLEWFRTPTPIKDVLEMLEDREALLALWSEGIIVRA